MFREFLASFRKKPQPASAADIRRELSAKRSRLDQLKAELDSLALSAVNDAVIAGKYLQLDSEATEVAREIRLLSAALPAAAAKEAEVQAAADAAALVERIAAFDRDASEARRFVDGVLERLVNGEELSIARDLSRSLAREATELHHATGNGRFRRPTDPLHDIRAALDHRIERLDRARWAPASPITLKEKKTA